MHHRISPSLWALALLLMTCGSLAAQSFPVRWTAPTNTLGHFPVGATTISDINADGSPDLAIISARAAVSGGAPEFEISFHCGVSGQFIHSSPPTPYPFSFALPYLPIHNVGDLDGDGLDDVVMLTSAPNLAFAELRTYSSATGSEILAAPIPTTAHFSPNQDTSVTIPDRNGNGTREIAVVVNTGGSGMFNNSLVVFDPLTGANLLPGSVPLGPSVGPLPTAIYKVGDTNNDGAPDLLVALSTGPSDKELTLISGADFSILLSVSVPAISITGVIGDTDGDGEVECGLNDGTTVVFVNIPSGTVTTTVPLPPSFGNLLPVTQNTGDLNGDEIDDFSMAFFIFAPVVRIYSGKTLQRLRMTTDAIDFSSLVATARLSDIDDDGSEELLALSQSQLCAISVAGAARYGGPMPALPLQLEWTESNTVGTTRGCISAVGGQPLGTGVVAVSLSNDFSVVNGTTILVDPNALVLNPATISFDALGRFTTPLELGIPALEGVSLFAQVFDVTNPQVTSSNGLELHFTLP